MSLVERSREPLRDPVASPAALDACLEALSSSRGPVAFDTERAHGHRYWPKAYLLQIRRAGAGTWLIDPIAFEAGGPADLSGLVEACGEASWIIHAASQDLPCMREIGIVPPRIFDSELAARLLGKPGASLGALLEAELGIRLRKAHSADNWSKRPLPSSWLTYAALDVDYLLELAAALADELVLSGRHIWAEQEFADTLAKHSAPPEPRPEPWRRVKGLSKLKTPLQLAVARELWHARDELAQRRDRPPTWLLPDDALLEVAEASRGSVVTDAQASGLPGLSRPPGQRHLKHWLAALERARNLTKSEFPSRQATTQGTPHPRGWGRANPEAAARWALVKPAVDELACSLGGLQASLIAPPNVLQEALWAGGTIDRARLLELGARPWQADFLAPLITQALARG